MEKIKEPVYIELVYSSFSAGQLTDVEQDIGNQKTSSFLSESTSYRKFDTANAIVEIKFRSGLTWELLSELFDVSRRTIHNWVNGMSPSAQHEKSIGYVLNAIKLIDEGDPSTTRSRLFTTVAGVSIFDLLSDQRYEDVLCQASGAGSGALERRQQISSEEVGMRQPPPPALLLNAIQDRPEIPSTKSGVVSVVRVKNR